MDRFGEMAAKMAGMPEDELRKEVSVLMAKCICGRCPTQNDCMKGKKETLFCVMGKTGCTVTKRGCLCPPCPVTPAMGLKHAFYCAQGSEKEIRGL